MRLTATGFAWETTGPDSWAFGKFRIIRIGEDFLRAVTPFFTRWQRANDTNQTNHPMSFELTAQLHQVSPTDQVTATFKKRAFVVRYASNPQYPQFVSMQLVQDKCSELDSVAPGTMVTVSFDLQGREWTDPKTNEKKYFTSLNAWRIKPAAPGATPPPPPAAFDAQAFGSDDDLPF